MEPSDSAETPPRHHAESQPLGEADIAFLRTIDSPTVANAVEQFDVRDRTEGFIGGRVRCLLPGLGRMVGQALTVKMTSTAGPVASRQGYWRMWEGLSGLIAPSVLVVQDISGEPSRCAYVGEVMATLAARLGCVGLVTDGGVRDLEELETLGFHLFAPYPVVSHGNFEIVDVGAEVVLDGQVVRTGDILHGDRNGIVIVPRETLQDLPAAVADVRAREQDLMEYYRSPGFALSQARRRAGY